MESITHFEIDNIYFGGNIIVIVIANAETAIFTA